jgi:hypothetical protein
MFRMIRLALLLSCVVGCTSKPGPATASAAETAIVQQYCTKAFACQGDWDGQEHLQDFVEPFTSSVSGCEAKYLLSSSDLATLDSDVVSGRVVYNDGTTQDCLDHNDAVSCGDWFDYPGDAPPPYCTGAFMGTLETGQACQLTFECNGGFCESGVCVN